jgi:hypothetical protein
MNKGTKTVIIMVALLLQVALVSCKKADTTGKGRSQMTPDTAQEHVMTQIKRSMEESKKVAAAKVNGETITMFTLLREMNIIGPQYLKPGQERTPELDAKVRKDALNILVFQELAMQEAKKRGMTVKPDLIDNAIKKIKADAKTGDAYQKYLADQSLTENELRKSIEENILFELIATQEIDAKIKVSDQELKKRYAKQKAELKKDAAHGKMTFEQAKAMLEQRIRDEAGEKRMREWEKELKKTAKIEIIEQKPKAGK